MWQRSEVEKLTGLSRHAIQDLCNQNTAAGGLGFWVPAISKPGFARYDEGDLLAFYLVKQFFKAGFTLAQMESVVFDMFETDSSFAQALSAQQNKLEAYRDKVNAKLTALAQIKQSLVSAPENRPYAIMEAALTSNCNTAFAKATAPADKNLLSKAQLDQFYHRAHLVVQTMFAIIKGESPASYYEHLQRLGEQIQALLAKGVSPKSQEAQQLVYLQAAALSGLQLLQQQPSSNNTFDATQLPTQESLLFEAALIFITTFCAEPENGTPIELVLGAKSFGFLAHASKACAEHFPARSK